MPLSRAYAIADLRAAAQRRLPRAIFDFFDGAAEDELTLRRNRQAFEDMRLMPRVLRDVSQVDTRTRLFGQSLSLPLAIAPTGAVGFGRPGGDIAIARAAAAAGIPYTLSSAGTASIEQIARAAPGRLWFQAYVLKNKPVFNTLIDRAQHADCEALVITVDLPVGGKRERDFHNDFAVPFRFTPRNVWDFAQHPAWALGLLRHGMPVMENLKDLDAANAHASSNATTRANRLASSVGRNYDSAFDWDALQRVRERWPRRLIVKGIVHPADAQRAADIGCDALIVSNHGGRQLDGGVATLDALPAVVQALNGRIPVLLDSGIRRGSDIVKALACGAAGVLTGRATLYGVCAGGQDGASQAIAILHDEFRRTMQLCGVAGVAAIDGGVVWGGGGDRKNEAVTRSSASE